MDAAIQAYLRLAASLWREVEQVGPFLATFTAGDPTPYLSYAIPDTGAAPTEEDVAALVEAFAGRDRTPRLEYLPSEAPAVEAALLAGGFHVEARLALMTCTPGALRPSAVPEGIEVLRPTTDDEHAGAISVTVEAYEGARLAPTAAQIERRRELVAAGGVVVLARDRRTQQPAGAGICDVPHHGVTELAAVGVATTFRRRGVAASVTAALAEAAFAAGTSLVWLTPQAAEGERLYRRLGFTTTSEALHISR